MSVQIITGDCIDELRKLADGSVNTIVTSPPYYNLRDYAVKGQLGSEKTVKEYVSVMVAVFAEARRALRDDGTLWLNLGDSYSSSGGAALSRGSGRTRLANGRGDQPAVLRKKIDDTSPARGAIEDGLKPKDLVGIPWRVAFALQADGWYLRSDIIWHKPNPMPESVTDRPTKAHEYIFLLSKQEKYYYDAAAIMEPVSEGTHARLSQNLAAQIGSHRANGGAKTNGPMKAVGRKASLGTNGVVKHNASFDASVCMPVTERNKRTVWTVPTAAVKDAHFATFPPALIRPCILAGCPRGGVVLDPFGGSGTTGEVAEQEGRNSILIELNPEYVEIARRRTAQTGLLHGT